MLLFFHILTRSFIFHNIPKMPHPRLLFDVHVVWLLRTNTTYLWQCCRQDSRQQVKPTMIDTYTKAQKKKWKIKILNCRINSRHTSEWIKWWKVWGKLFTTLSVEKHSFASDLYEQELSSLDDVQLVGFFMLPMWCIFRTIQFAIFRFSSSNIFFQPLADVSCW